MGGKKQVRDWMFRMKRLQESGYFKASKIYNFMKSLEQVEMPQTPLTKKISYPEDKYIKIYYERYPEIKTQAVDLNSFVPSFVRRFAWRQMELIKEGHTEEEAFEITDSEMMREKKIKEELFQIKSTMRIVQEEEEKVLIKAMREHIERKRTI